jgi:hypothetical protein
MKRLYGFFVSGVINRGISACRLADLSSQTHRAKNPLIQRFEGPAVCLREINGRHRVFDSVWP